MQSLEYDKKINSAGQSDQLNALRFKMQSGNKNSPREKGGKISENEMPGMGEEIPKEETYNRDGGGARKSKSMILANMGLLRWYIFRKYRMAVFN